MIKLQLNKLRELLGVIREALLILSTHIKAPLVSSSSMKDYQSKIGELRAELIGGVRELLMREK